MRSSKALLAAVAALALVPAVARAADYHPEDEPPFGGRVAPELVEPGNLHVAPPGFRLTPQAAKRIAGQAVGGDRVVKAYTRGPGVWQVSLGEPERVRVFVDDSTGKVIEHWTGTQVGSELARGYKDAVGWEVPAVWFFLPLCLLFLAPFIDLRRPLRLLHLDLLVLLGFGVSLFFFERGNIDASVPLVYPVLGYLFGRLAYSGFRPTYSPGKAAPAHLAEAAGGRHRGAGRPARLHGGRVQEGDRRRAGGGDGG